VITGDATTHSLSQRRTRVARARKRHPWLQLVRPACTGVKLGVDRAPLRLGLLAKDSLRRARSAPLTVDDLDTRVICSPSSLFCQRRSVDTMTRAGTRRRLALARLLPARLTRRWALGQILLARLMRRCMGGNPRRRGGTSHREGRQCYSSGVGVATAATVAVAAAAAGGRRRRRGGGAAAARLLASVRTSSAPKGTSECPSRLLLYQYAECPSRLLLFQYADCGARATVRLYYGPHHTQNQSPTDHVRLYDCTSNSIPRTGCIHAHTRPTCPLQTRWLGRLHGPPWLRRRPRSCRPRRRPRSSPRSSDSQS
jgi:hypothetical protein